MKRFIFKIQCAFVAAKAAFMHPDIMLPDHFNILADIISNGAQIEMKAQEVRELKGEQVQVIECKIYFISND